MKLVKMLGVALAGALLWVAIGGAASAPAAVLCTTNETCSESHLTEEGEMLDVGDTLVGTASDLVLTGTPEVTCTHSVTEVEVSAAEPAAGEIVGLDFTGCAAKTILGNVQCTVSVLNLPYAAAVNAAGEGNGTLKVTGINGSPEAFVSCAGVVNCTYGNSEFVLPVSGGNPVQITANKVPLAIQKGFLCPASMTWDATYQATGELTSVFVR